MLKYKKSLYVTNVITLNAFRKKGVASQLFEELIRRYGKEQMVLDVKKHLESAQKLVSYHAYVECLTLSVLLIAA